MKNKLAWASSIIFVAIIGLVSVVLWRTSHSSQNDMPEYATAKERQIAQWLVDGLNTHDPQKVGLARNSSGDPAASEDNAELDRLIVAAMPPSGCSYNLDSVTDRGQQGVRQFRWGAVPTYRFDMQLTEHCRGQDPVGRVIGVISIPSEGAHWEEVSFVVE